MKVHELKTWPREFRAVARGQKAFEVRKNDRGFETDDIVILREFVPPHLVGERMEGSEFRYEQPGFTCRAPLGPFRIGYVTECSALPDGWVGFELIRLVPEMEK
jgi:hypothetical protein